MRGKPKRGKQAKRRQWRSKRACFEDGPRFSGTKCTETGWADGVFLFRAGRKNFRHAEKGTADFRCSFCIYASKTISRVLYLTVIYLDAPLPVRSSHPGSGRASLGAEAPAPIPVLLRIEFTAMGTLTHHRVSSYLAFPPLPPGLRPGGKPIPDGIGRCGG